MRKVVKYSKISQMRIELSRQDILKILHDYLQKECPNIDKAQDVDVYVLEKECDDKLDIDNDYGSQNGTRLCINVKFEETGSE